MRDFLYTIIHFAKGSRSGVTAYFSVEEFKKAKRLGDGHAIDVWGHKTLESHGAAKVWLTNEEFFYVTVFADYVRVQLPPLDPEVFLSWIGKSIKSGDVSKRIHVLWVGAGIIDENAPKKMSSNIIRKSVSTGLMEKNSMYLQEVCDTMSHSMTTQAQHYWPRQKEISLLKGSMAMRNHFYAAMSQSPQISTNPQSPQSKNHTPPVHENPQIHHTPQQPVRSPRKVWSPCEAETLLNSFNGDEDITMDFVKKKIDNQNLRLNASPKQTYDKLRSLKRYQQDQADQGVSYTYFSFILSLIFIIILFLFFEVALLY